MKRRIAAAAAITAAVVVLVMQAPADSAPQRMTPLNLFAALKTKVDRQGYKILANHLAIADLEAQADYNDACTESVVDLGAMLDEYVGPLRPGWEPLATKGYYALLISSDCVEVDPQPAEQHAEPDAKDTNEYRIKEVTP